MTFQSIVTGVLLGIGATILMDVWNLFLKAAFGIPSLNYCFLGRWILHMPDGVFHHDSIGKASQKAGECIVGRVAHYTIGVSLAVLFVLISEGWLAQPTLVRALVFGIATVVFPFFLMQPALGLGVASSRAAKPTQARLKSLATHTIFGVGLYATALALTRIFPLS